MMKAFRKVLAIELALAARNPDMLLFGIAFPIGLILLLGFVSSPEALRLDFGGVACFGICAAGLMGLPLTISDYRHRKVLKRFRVTPASQALLLGAQLLVQCAYVAVSAGAVCLIALVGFGVRIEGGALRFAASFLLVQASVFGIGALVGAVSPNAKVSNAVASALYFPMILLSGATIPFEIFPKALQAAAQVLPVTLGIRLLKGAVLGSPPGELALPVAVLSLLAVATYSIAIAKFKWE